MHKKQFVQNYSKRNYKLANSKKFIIFDDDSLPYKHKVVSFRYSSSSRLHLAGSTQNQPIVNKKVLPCHYCTAAGSRYSAAVYNISSVSQHLAT